MQEAVMVQLELGEVQEADLSKRAHERGMEPAELVKQFVASGMKQYSNPPSADVIALRQQLAAKMLEESKGRKLGLKDMGLTMSEFIREGHKY